MMKNQSVLRVLTGLLSVTALAFCFAAQTANAQRPTKRVAPKTPSKRVASEVAVETSHATYQRPFRMGRGRASTQSARHTTSINVGASGGKTGGSQRN